MCFTISFHVCVFVWTCHPTWSLLEGMFHDMFGVRYVCVLLVRTETGFTICYDGRGQGTKNGYRHHGMLHGMFVY
jgi:hypothetical protein